MSWAQYISRYVAVVIEKLHNAKELEAHGRRVLAHELVNLIDTMDRSGQKIGGYVDSLPSTVAKPPNMAAWISDLRVIAKQARGMIVNWADPKSANELDLLALGLLGAAPNSRPKGRAYFYAELKTCIESFREEIKRRKLELSVSAHGSDFFLPIAPEFLRIILNNLISNAVKYSSPGSVIICGFNRAAYSRTFHIRNIGVALTGAEQHRLFDIWFRGPQTKEKVEGSGLGLYIVKRVCDSHGLAIRYAESPAKGNSANVWHWMNIDVPGHLVTDG